MGRSEANLSLTRIGLAARNAEKGEIIDGKG
jgi:hypothetical protein